MEEVNLPIEIAQEPKEEARLSQPQKELSDTMIKPKNVKFAEATQSSDNQSQCSTTTYADALSLPTLTLSHKQKLLWLQKRRSPGLWVQCDDCNKWRYVSDVIDAFELPSKWVCKMNPDKTFAKCSIPEKPLRLREEEDLIEGKYFAGSVVWARLAGWPWWPAMVDDCPDTEQFYWLDGFSDIPTHYNVVFFDAVEVTRAWITPANLQPFAPNKQSFKLPKAKNLRKRMEVAIRQAEDADKLSLGERLEKYSFVSRYPGSINKPKKITKREIQKYQDKLKRKYDIDFSGDNMEDDAIQAEVETTVVQKKSNLLLVGTPKTHVNKSCISDSNYNGKKAKRDSLIESMINTDTDKTICDTENIVEKENPQTIEDNLNEMFKQPNSLAVQVGSTVTSTVADINTFDNDTSATYVPGSESESESIRATAESIARAVSPSSDDFEF